MRENEIRHDLNRGQRNGSRFALESGSGSRQSRIATSLAVSEQELRRQLRDLSTLTAVSMVLNSTLDPEEVLRTVVSAVTQVIGCQKSAIFDLDPTGAVLYLRTSHGLSTDFIQEAQGLLVGDWWTDVAVTGEVVAVSDIAADPRFTEFVAMAEAENFRSFVDLPLVVQGQIVGCLTVYFTEPRTFTEFELELLAIFANQAASAMHNARLYDRLERRVRELSGLVEIDKALTAIPRLILVLPGLAEGLCRVLDAAGGILLLWEEDRQERGGRGATVGLSSQVLQLLKDAPDELLLAAETAARREAVVVEDVVTDRLVGERLAAQFGFSTMVGLPLVTGGEVVGVMVLGDPRWVEQEALDRAMLAARQAALAIANALLFEETSRQAQDLMALSRAAWTVASLGGLDTVLSQLLQELDRIVPADISAVYLHTEESDAPVLMAFRGQSWEDGFGLGDATWRDLLEWVTRQKQPLLLGERKIGTVFEGLAQGVSGSLLCVPILYENHCLGVIALEYQWEDAFGQREQALVTSFADHAAVAIENALRYDAVLQERNLSQTIIASMADGVVVTDAEDNVVIHNQAAQEMVGMQMGQCWSRDRLSDELVGWVRSLAKADGPALVGSRWQTTLEREGRVLSVSTTPLPSGDGENQGAVYVIRDITYWAELDQMKSDFISQVSHELRTPLATVKTLVGLLKKGGQSGNEVREYLDIIESEVDRQAQLINDLLEMGRLEAGEVSWTMVEVSLNEIAEQAMRVCLPLATEKQIGLIGHPLPTLPRIMGTPRRLHQVLVNLLINAIKYTPPGGRVTVETGSDEPSVWVAVRDTGIGIPKAELPHVFDKFYQVRQSGRSPGGVGLGLAIAQQIVEALNGTLEVESEVGRGSCFTVRLPRARKIVAEMRESLKGVEDERAHSVDR